MKIYFPNCKRYIRVKIAHKSKGLYSRRNITPEPAEARILHGVVMTPTSDGGIKYTLEKNKQLPLAYNFLLHKPKRKSLHITNLTNELETVYYDGSELADIFEQNPHLSRTVGALPQKWGRKIGASKEKREQIDKLFSKFAKKFHKLVKNKDSKVEINTGRLEKELSKVLSSKVEISKLGKGVWGQTYKINVDSQDFVLKVYYRDKSPKGYGSSIYYHGNYHELSSAVWSSKNDAGKYAMFYMGRFGEKHNGYMLTRYIPKEDTNRIYNNLPEISKQNFVFSKYIHRLSCGDLGREFSNLHGRKVIDFGYTFISDAGKLDRKTYLLTKTLGRLIDENNSKELDMIIAKNQGTEELEQAKSFLQYLINRYTTVNNAQILKTKASMLAKLGLDYTPDIRYILSCMRFPLHTKYEMATNINIKNYSQILDIPQNSFENLWYKYQKIIGLTKLMTKLN
ncbi:hypothetical protein IJ596_04955 [bacterium]|nr:hypothetical protein [bacterium]